MPKVLLYGAGGYGHDAFERFHDNGQDALLIGFIDNNPLYHGKDLFHLPIYTYEEAKSLLSSDPSIIVLITPAIDTALKISKQLRSDGYMRFLHWSLEQTTPWRELISFIENANDTAILARTLDYEIRALTWQRDYLITHIDPQSMKPATGALRDHQLSLISLMQDFVTLTSELHISPFLIYGSLLGHVRHDGFIPWDDDFDLGVTREDFNSIRSFFQSNDRYLYYTGCFNNDNQQRLWYKTQTALYPNTILAMERPLLLRICRKSDADDIVSFIDLFPVDFYKDSFTYKDRKILVDSYSTRMISISSPNEFSKLLTDIKETEKPYLDPDGNHLYFGLDTLGAYFAPARTEAWLDRSDLFPLQQTIFEGIPVYLPNHPASWLLKAYGPNYMTLRSDVALQSHMSTLHF